MFHAAGRSFSRRVCRRLLPVVIPVAAALCVSPSISARVVGTYTGPDGTAAILAAVSPSASRRALTTHEPAPASSPSLTPLPH